MVIDKSKNDRVSLTIDKQLKLQCKELAKEESRTLNSFIINAIKEYIRTNKKE